MTQALNLANFANNLNTSGATSNAGLQNSSVTVTAGSGLSGGGAVSLGGTVSLANAGVTSLTAGTGISLNASTGAITVTNTSSASGTVTSVATGNGLQGGTITTSGTLSVAAPSWNSVGSYCLGAYRRDGGSSTNYDTNVSTGTGDGQLSVYQNINWYYPCIATLFNFTGNSGRQNVLSGTWKLLSSAQGSSSVGANYMAVLAVRVS